MERLGTNSDEDTPDIKSLKKFKNTLVEILTSDGEDPNLLPRSAIIKITKRLYHQIGGNRFKAFVSAYQKDHYELNKTVSYLVGLRSVVMTIHILNDLEFDAPASFQEIIYRSLLDVESALNARQYNTYGLYADALKIGKPSSAS
jgi:hypothetical protein